MMTRFNLALLAVALSLTACDRGSNGSRDSVTPAPSGRDTASARPADPTARDAAPAPSTNPAAAAAPAADAGDDPRLYGTWVARDVEVSMGEVKVQLSFKRDDGPVRILAWSDLPFVGQVRNKTADYEVKGNTITSQALRGGTSVNYRFDGGDLIIEYKDGKAVRFKRQS